MSDFLSKFSKDKYEDTLDDKAKSPTPKERVSSPAEGSDIPSQQEKPSTPIHEDPPPKPKPKPVEEKKTVSRHAMEDTVIDPEYKKNRQKKFIIASVVAVVILLLLYLLYYNMTRVVMPDFVEKQISEARQWGSKNSITFNANPVFSKEHPANVIVSQAVEPGKRVKKGSFVDMDVSKGADPEETLPLPDFSQMDIESARLWIEENRADNLSLVRQFNDTVETGKYIKLELSDKSIQPQDYKRKDNGILYFSKGPEVLEKNINVPAFQGKARLEAETWATSNDIALSVEEMTSDSIESGHVINQSVKPGEKVAKKDSFKITVSLGKGVVVPDFRDYTAETVSEVAGLSIHVQQRYSEGVPYGYLISQSVPSGKKLTERDDKNITLVYSLGQPYIKDLRGVVTEAELQKYFFDEYQSKGANIDYHVAHVTSQEPRGTIITQSVYSSLLPMKYTVKLGVSAGPNYVGDNPVGSNPVSGGGGNEDSIRPSK